MKFYGMVFGDWRGIDWENLEDVFYKEEDCEKRIEELEWELSPEEWFEVWEMDEEQVKKYWGEREIS